MADKDVQKVLTLLGLPSEASASIEKVLDRWSPGHTIMPGAGHTLAPGTVIEPAGNLGDLVEPGAPITRGFRETSKTLVMDFEELNEVLETGRERHGLPASKKSVIYFDHIDDSPTTEMAIVEADTKLDSDDDEGLSEWSTDEMPIARRTSGTWHPNRPPGDQTEQPVQYDSSRRYQDLGLLGEGGMGEVRRVYDRDLNRPLALKIILPQLVNDKNVVSRFISEAQATGQLQHPGIVPVHELGRLADGRYYFTMREIRGANLGDIIDEFHIARDDGPPTEWTLRRLVDVMLKVAEATAYAHSRNVLHRDIKPENILVGDFGEVLLVDWGLAKVIGTDDGDELETGQFSVTTQRTEGDGEALKTVVGSVAGTPSYMPIEQALGDNDAQQKHSDVYALGAVLYDVLCGHPPYQADTAVGTLKLLLKGKAEPIPEGPEYPEELRAICMKAMARKPEDRYVDGAAVVDALSGWLEGARRREEALNMLNDAKEKTEGRVRLRARADALRSEAVQMLDGVPVLAPMEQKKAAWRRFDSAKQLDSGAEVLEMLAIQLARAALAHDPDLGEANELLANHYRKQHEESEEAGDVAGEERARAMLRAHDRGRYADYLLGDGALTFVPDAKDADIEIFRIEERSRRLVPLPWGKPQKGALKEFELPMGSYQLIVRAEGRVPVRYPVRIGRQEHCTGIRPGGNAPYPIYLPEVDELRPSEVYVPAGWFIFGGDPAAPNAAPRGKVWVDGFVMQKYPVTNIEYVRFLSSLVKYRREDEANAFAPAMGMVQDQHGNWWLPIGDDENAEEDEEQGAEEPVLMVNWHASMAYATWLAERESLMWRLPHELEWEKAARGVDGRAYPMGPFLDPTWAATGRSHIDVASHKDIYAFPDDESVYGVQGMAGNTRDWCRTPFSETDLDVKELLLDVKRIRPQAEGPIYRSTRGGTWSGTANECRPAARYRRLQDAVSAELGFRLVRSFGAPR